ncbi:MAG TPA: helix-turn-helix transcriptional regulator, partial [Puia sp.]|nr:helix-turn-helix transcriptional regulator [Puia sp.]
DEFLLLVGNKIRNKRESKNITQEELAHNLEIDYSQINRMELGKVNFSISWIARIAKALDTNPKELIP